MPCMLVHSKRQLFVQMLAGGKAAKPLIHRKSMSPISTLSTGHCASRRKVYFLFTELANAMYVGLYQTTVACVDGGLQASCCSAHTLLVYQPHLDFVHRALRILVKSGLTFH